MSTLIELYDTESLENTIATLALVPDNVVYVGEKHAMSQLWRRSISRLYQKYRLQTKVHFLEVDPKNKQSILNALESLKDKKPVINTSGGNDMILFYTSIFAFQNNLCTFSLDFKTRRIIHLCGDSSELSEFRWPHIVIDDIVAMAGGTLIRHARASEIHDNEALYSDVMAVWNLYMKNRDSWAKQVYYFQQLKQDGALSINAPLVIFPENNQIARCNVSILKQLEEIGILLNVHEEKDRIKFEFKNEFMRHSLADTGIWLELYTYITAKKLELFDDVQMSVVVDWDDNTEERPNTTNEIDVVLLKGAISVFVSCKTSEPSVSALNEINTLTRRFGGHRARCALVTSAKPQSSLIKRANDMGLSLISLCDMNETDFGAALAKLVSSYTI